MGEDGFAHGGEFAVVHEGAGIGRAPELASDELGVALEEGGRTGGLILVERFGVGVRWARCDVVEFQVCERRNPDDAMRVGLEAGAGKIIAGEVNGE